jgi:EamA domain-containing membrane protein RarD
VNILKRYIISFGFLAFAAVDVAVYVAALRGHDSSSVLFISLITNVIFLAVALTIGKKVDPPKFTPGHKRKASWRMKLIGAVLVAICATNVMYTVRRGTPLKDNDGFYIKTLSGKHIEISKQEYEELSKLQTRLFSGTWLAINLAFASSILLQE